MKRFTVSGIIGSGQDDAGTPEEDADPARHPARAYQVSALIAALPPRSRVRLLCEEGFERTIMASVTYSISGAICRVQRNRVMGCRSVPFSVSQPASYECQCAHRQRDDAGGVNLPFDIYEQHRDRRDCQNRQNRQSADHERDPERPPECRHSNQGSVQSSRVAKW
jgi:hypothetical protein